MQRSDERQKRLDLEEEVRELMLIFLSLAIEFERFSNAKLTEKWYYKKWHVTLSQHIL